MRLPSSLPAIMMMVTRKVLRIFDVRGLPLQLPLLLVVVCPLLSRPGHSSIHHRHRHHSPMLVHAFQTVPFGIHHRHHRRASFFHDQDADAGAGATASSSCSSSALVGGTRSSTMTTRTMTRTRTMTTMLHAEKKKDKKSFANPNDYETPEQRAKRMESVKQIQKSFYADSVGVQFDHDTQTTMATTDRDDDDDKNDAKTKKKNKKVIKLVKTTNTKMKATSSTILRNVPLWRVQWTQLPGYQNVLNCYAHHYTHMFMSVINGPKPWYFGHVFLPGASENLDSPEYRLPDYNNKNHHNDPDHSLKDDVGANNATLTGVLMQVTDYEQVETDGRLVLIVQALERFRILGATQHVPYAIANVELYPDEELIRSHYDKAADAYDSYASVNNINDDHHPHDNDNQGEKNSILYYDDWADDIDVVAEGTAPSPFIPKDHRGIDNDEDDDDDDGGMKTKAVRNDLQDDESHHQGDGSERDDLARWSAAQAGAVAEAVQWHPFEFRHVPIDECRVGERERHEEKEGVSPLANYDESILDSSMMMMPFPFSTTSSMSSLSSLSSTRSITSSSRSAEAARAVKSAIDAHYERNAPPSAAATAAAAAESTRRRQRRTGGENSERAQYNDQDHHDNEDDDESAGGGGHRRLDTLALERDVWIALDRMIRLLTDLSPTKKSPFAVPTQILSLLPTSLSSSSPSSTSSSLLTLDDYDYDEYEDEDEDEEAYWPDGFQLHKHAIRLQQSKMAKDDDENDDDENDEDDARLHLLSFFESFGGTMPMSLLLSSSSPSSFVWVDKAADAAAEQYPPLRRASRFSYAVWMLLEGIELDDDDDDDDMYDLSFMTMMPTTALRQRMLEYPTTAERLEAALERFGVINAALLEQQQEEQ